MKYFSTFSGIGGFELGIKQAYDLQDILSSEERQHETESTTSVGQSRLDTESTTRLGYPICVGFSEIDKYATQIYQKHFPNHKNYGDIQNIKTSELEDFDLLVGGFPCQSFSIAGKRGGFNDTRGTLFFEIARIVREKQPRLLLLENVKGLLSHDKGNTFRTIISTLDELGYDCQWQILNSKNHGVPQNRERVFIIGHLRGTSRPEVFPFAGTDEEGAAKVIQTNQSKESGGVQPYQQNRVYDDSGLSPALPAELGGERSHLINQLNQPKHSNDRVYGEDGISPTLNTAQGGNRQPFISLQYKGLFDKLGIYDTKKERNSIKTLRVLQEKVGTKAFTEWGLGVLDSFQQEEVLQPILHGESIRHKANKKASEVDDGTLSRKKDLSERELYSLWKSQNGSSPYQPRLARQFTRKLAEGLSELSQQDTPLRIRRLTPLEAERLQGFPNNWTEGLSDSQRYKTLGNAVTVNVVKEIIKKILKEKTPNAVR